MEWGDWAALEPLLGAQLSKQYRRRFLTSRSARNGHERDRGQATAHKPQGRRQNGVRANDEFLSLDFMRKPIVRCRMASSQELYSRVAQRWQVMASVAQPWPLDEIRSQDLHSLQYGRLLLQRGL